MTTKGTAGSHSAEDSALGFYYQTFFALLTLLDQHTDDAVISVETLDDVEMQVDGKPFLFQLKHSLQENPPAISLKSRALWRTLKAWIDVLPNVSISEAHFRLVSVAPLADELTAFLSIDSDRTQLHTDLVHEAQRVLDERKAAKEAETKLPHDDRVAGCTAFIDLLPEEQLLLISRVTLQPQSPTIGDIEPLIASRLHMLPLNQRNESASKLVQWWEREMIRALCGKRERLVQRLELQLAISEIIRDLAQERLLPEFTHAIPPEDYEPNGMIGRQIDLVSGKRTDHDRARREQWRAREQRASWTNARPGMATKIDDYDLVLKEHWADKHERLIEDCDGGDEPTKCDGGLKLLRWSHDTAHIEISPFSSDWTSPYYLRGSYQILASNLTIGWHPEFMDRLSPKEEE